MRLRRRTSPLFLLFLAFILTFGRGTAVAVRRHLADAKAILASPNFLDFGKFFQTLTASILSSAPHFDAHESNAWRNILHSSSRKRDLRPTAVDRKSDGTTEGNFVVLFRRSPNEKGNIVASTAQKADDDSRQSVKSERPSSGTEPVIVLGDKSPESASNNRNFSRDGNTTTSELSSLSQNHGRTNSPYSVSEADTYLNVTKDEDNAKDGISMTSGATQTSTPEENASEDQLGEIDGSPEVLLGSTEIESDPTEDDNDKNSETDDHSPDYDFKPIPSVAPGRQEEIHISLTYPNGGGFSPDPVDLEEEVQNNGENPVTITPLVAGEQADATAEVTVSEPEVTNELPSAREPEATDALPSANEPEGADELPFANEPEGADQLPSGKEPEGADQLPYGKEPEVTDQLTYGKEPEVTDEVPPTKEPERADEFPPAKLEVKPPNSGNARPMPEGTETTLTEPKVLVEVALSVTSSQDLNASQFDNYTRQYLGKSTNTSADQWKPTNVSTTARMLLRKQQTTLKISYQGKLSEASAPASVKKLEKTINEGAMDTYLAKQLSTEVTVRTAATPSLDAPPGEEVPVTASTPKETVSGTATTDTEEDEGGSRLGVILGTCFGLLGAVIVGAAALVFAKQRRGSDEHLLDGEPTTPTTIMSYETDGNESSYQTGAPTKPRGPNVLSNQSRILDWQMDHATATGEA